MSLASFIDNARPATAAITNDNPIVAAAIDVVMVTPNTRLLTVANFCAPSKNNVLAAFSDVANAAISCTPASNAIAACAFCAASAICLFSVPNKAVAPAATDAAAATPFIAPTIASIRFVSDDKALIFSFTSPKWSVNSAALLVICSNSLPLKLPDAICFLRSRNSALSDFAPCIASVLLLVNCSNSFAAFPSTFCDIVFAKSSTSFDNLPNSVADLFTFCMNSFCS